MKKTNHFKLARCENDVHLPFKTEKRKNKRGLKAYVVDYIL